MHCLFEKGSHDDTPVWIALHGSRRDETDMPLLVRSFAPEDAVIAPRGRVACSGGYAFFRRNPDRTLDETEIATRAAQLERFLRETVAQRAAHRPLYLYGLSNGAIMGAALLLRGAVSVSGAVLVRPMPPFPADCADASIDAPVLILAGRSDPRRRPDDAVLLADQLRRRGSPVSLRLTGAGHAPSDDDHQATRDWLRGLV